MNKINGLPASDRIARQLGNQATGGGVTKTKGQRPEVFHFPQPQLAELRAGGVASQRIRYRLA
jgi:hypothetical protein